MKADGQMSPVWNIAASAYVVSRGFLGRAPMKCRMSRNDLHGDGVAVPSRGHACAGASAFLR